MKSLFVKGMSHGIPIALGYLSVSFGIGIMATRAGLSVAEAVVLSATNLTSAGQAAGIGVMAAGGTLFEMALTQLVINLRYALMGISLSQKLDPSFRTLQRLIASFGITDETFAVASAQPGTVKPTYLYGMILVSFLGWVLGTFLGAAAGSILPAALTDAMGIVLYGMFLAIFIPPARRRRGVLLAVAAAALCSIVFYYVLTMVSSGFAVIISAVIAAAAAAVLFPAPEEGGEAS